MTSPSSFVPSSMLATIATWMAIAAACGGRTTTDSTDPGNSGGTNDPGSTSTTGSTTGTTGTTTGGYGSTGSTGGSSFGGDVSGGSGSPAGTGVSATGGSAGSATCQNVGCPKIACGAGFQSVMVPGACCPGCVPCTVDCAVSCAPGSHYQVVPGQCCGICVADPKSCDQGRKDYQTTRAQLLDKYSAPCMTDANCLIASEINECANSCGVAVLAVNADNWKSNLISSAKSNCAGCPPTPIPPCLPLQARCVMNRCIATSGVQ